MKTPICKTHKVEMTFKPNGMGKNGAYTAFFGCPNYPECKESVNIPEKLGRLMSMEHQFTRSKEIAWFNSTNGAIELAKPLIKDIIDNRDRDEIKQRKEYVKSWRDFFMSEWKAFYLREILEEKDEDLEKLKAKLEKE